MEVTPVSEVFTGERDVPLGDSSAPVTVTVAPTITAPLGSTTVIRSVPAGGACPSRFSTERLTESAVARIISTPRTSAGRFSQDIIFVEAAHQVTMTRDQYLAAWHS